MSLGAVVFSSRYVDTATLSSSPTSSTSTADFNDNVLGQLPVRRPLRGVVVRPNSYASLTVSSTTSASPRLYSTTVAPLNAGDPGMTASTTDFIVQSVSVQRSEKFQPIPTFGASLGYFFGEQHYFLSVRAILLDTEDFPWKRDWWANYEESLRGTKLAERGERAVLNVNGALVEGYLTQAGTDENANEEGYCQLSFTIWVTNIVYEGQAGSGVLSYGGNHTITADTERIPALPASRPATGRDDPGLDGLAGVLANIRGFFSRVRTALGDAMDAAEDFLLGRDIVIPAAGYSDVSDVLTPDEINTVRGTIELTTPPYPWLTYAKQLADNADGYTWENWDEYLQGWQTTNLTDSAYTGTWAGARRLVSGESPGWLGTSMREALEQRAAAKIEAEMRLLEPRWDINTGYRTPEAMRRLGRGIYSAISLAASFSRADEVLQSVTSMYTPIEAQTNEQNAVAPRNRPASETPLPRGSGVAWPAGT